MKINTHQQHQDQEDHGRSPEMHNEYNNNWIQESRSIIPESVLYPGSAILNPEELSTFPKHVSVDNNHHHHHESHLVNKRTPVREGRNITRTDNHPDRNGFI